MTTSSISPIATFARPDASKREARAAAFGALQSSLQSGDLAAAQKAFATLEAGRPKEPSGSGDATKGPKADIANLAKALQSGDMTAARSAFASLQADFKSKGAHQRPSGPPPLAPGMDSDGDHDGSGGSFASSSPGTFSIAA